MSKVAPHATLEPSASGSRLGLVSEGFHRFNSTERQLSSIIIGFMEMEHQVPEQEFAELLRTQLSGRYPVFRSRAVRPTDAKEKRYTTWETQPVAEFDLQSHIKTKRITLPEPTSQARHTALQQHASQKALAPLPTWGPWEVTLITYESPGDGRQSEALQGCDIMWRVSHAIGDGMMISAVLLDICKPTHPDESRSGLTQARPKRKVCCWTALCRSLTALCKGLTVGCGCYRKDKPSALHQHYSALKMEKTVSLCKSRWSLVATKAAAKYYDCTINDLLTTVVAEACSNYFAESKAQHPDPPPTIQLCMVINLRLLSAAAVAKELEAFQVGEGNNKIGIAAIQVPVGPMSRDERLGQVQHTLSRMKTTPEPQLFVFLNRTLRSMVGLRKVTETNKEYLSSMTATYSNVPGPQHSLSLCGVRITRISNVVTPFVYGLSVSIISYDGTISYGATSDNNVVERPERLTELVEEAFVSFLEPVSSDHPAVLP